MTHEFPDYQLDSWCPIQDPGPDIQLRYIQRSALAGVAMGSGELAGRVGRTLATIETRRKVHHAMSDLLLEGLLSDAAEIEVSNYIDGDPMSEVEDFLWKLGYVSDTTDDGYKVEPVLPVGERIAKYGGVCHYRGYDTFAINTTDAVSVMQADNIPMSDRKANMLPGLRIVSGNDGMRGTAADMIPDALVVLPYKISRTATLIPGQSIERQLSLPTALRPAEALTYVLLSQRLYRREVLARIMNVGIFFANSYRMSPSENAARVKERVHAIAQLASVVDSLLSEPLLHHRPFVRKLGQISTIFTAKTGTEIPGDGSYLIPYRGSVPLSRRVRLATE
ncbi:MAG TPA: hypothetical protein VMB52_04860 [Verrucomicrobiae bacterium]|nr:hypothetical protein [Verrucomicrobiae bacterium]